MTVRRGVSRLERVKKIKNNDFTEGAIFGKLIKFALPLMATGMLQMLYNASDMIVVGRFSPGGENSMGAVGACSALINLILNLFMGLATGAGVLAAQNIGAKKYDHLKKVVDTSVVTSLICGVVLAIFGFFMAEPLLTLMGTPDAVIIEAVPYMKAYFVGVPACMLYNFLAAILRSSGDSKRPLIFLAISGLCNVGLNLIMVLCFSMGAIGVGIATSAAQYISAAMIFIYMSRADIVCKIDLKGIKPNKEKLLSMIRIGMPAGVQGMLFSISNVLMQSTVNTYGDIVVNGNAAAANIEGFVYICMNAMYHSTLTFVGQNVGAGKYDRLKKIIFQNALLVSAVGLVIGVAVTIFHEPLLMIYAPESAAVRDAAAIRLYMICSTYFLCGLMEVGCGAVRGMGRAILPMMVSLTGSCLLRIVWIFTICPFFPGNIYVLYLCYPITWLVTSAAHFASSTVVSKRMKRDALASKSAAQA